MALGNKIAKKKDGEVSPATLRHLVSQMAPGIQRALPAMIGKERFIRCAQSAISNNAKLAECTQNSFIGALMSAAQLGLEPNTPLGQAYLIPYSGVVQFQLGYKGLIELARRAGITIQVHEICEKDLFEYEYGLDPKLRHVPSLTGRGKVIGYYCLWKNKDGQYGIEVASRSEIDAFAKEKSQAYKNGPWKTDFDAMAKKTMIKRALKYAPVAVEVGNGIAADNTVKNVSLKDIESDGFDINLVKDETPQEEPEPAKPIADQKTGEVIDAEVIDRPEPDDPGESLI